MNSKTLPYLLRGRFEHWKFLGSQFWILPFLANCVLWVGTALAFVLSGIAGCAAKKPAPVSPMGQHPTHRIAILPFESSNPYIPGTSLSDYFVVQILRDTSGLDVVERKDLMRILQEQKLALTGLIRPDKFARLGNILGVQAILVGSVSTLETLQSTRGSISVTLKLMEVSTGRVIWADRQVIAHSTWSVKDVEEVAERIMEKAAKKMVEQMGKDNAFSRLKEADFEASLALAQYQGEMP
ncbi:MAG: hypothetical protein A2901_06205 [Elusimicrobia bacterium RIFCSPLOWO2_01_FULL_54_10]|nr:MAG: hypothetical protein A2901_06205 [Elusimicrobia bacterium RIFCSPLOWO2_01_FULL_54_10]